MNVRREATETATYLPYRFMSWLGPLLPVRSGRTAYEQAGRLFFRLAAGPRAVVAANQAQVLGRPADDALVQVSTREAFALYGRYWFDTFNVLGMTPRGRRRLPVRGDRAGREGLRPRARAS